MARKSFEGPKKRPKTTEGERTASLIALATLGTLATANFAVDAKINSAQGASATAERVERKPTNLEGLFEGSAKAYQILSGEMTRGQVLFVDERGAPIGAPREVPFDRGDKGEAWFTKEGLAEARRELCIQYPNIVCSVERALPHQINNLGVLKDYPEGTVYLDIVRENGLDRKVLPLPGIPGPQEGAGLSRVEYIWRFIGKDISVKDMSARERFIDLAPALVAQESKYENDLTSSAGARNLMQIMPATRAGLGYDEQELKYLRTQVTAMGRLFSEKYSTLEKNKYARQLRDVFFTGDNEQYIREFLVPATLTSYNAGPPQIKSLFEWFSKKYPSRDAYEAIHGALPAELDAGFFLAMLKEAFEQKKTNGKKLFPWLGPDVLTYYVRIVALEKEMKARGFYGKTEQ